ncbi:DUF2141 domain-containing protein [Flavobacterium crassostreae]|uniref:DUF2141 domain-containing protein n=1 Tax=Flavobacterium crassostreae TaxID=1763534 RepID=A0A1B9DTI8_9FLAO|nr:DUF2141 domain-containing protein [Flavobacterium crassostreae]OCB72987.1 hypothetical protein LPBF_11280 [Flavobacterium crassostreae]
MKLLLLFLSLIYYHAEAQSTQLHVTINNIQTKTGMINLAVFNNGSNYLKEGAAYKNYFIAVKSTTESITITDLPKGEYAVSMYHDVNADYKLNKNVLGIPTEPFGFSNNVVLKHAPPTYNQCKFYLKDTKHILIKLSSI